MFPDILEKDLHKAKGIIFLQRKEANLIFDPPITYVANKVSVYKEKRARVSCMPAYKRRLDLDAP